MMIDRKREFLNYGESQPHEYAEVGSPTERKRSQGEIAAERTCLKLAAKQARRGVTPETETQNSGPRTTTVEPFMLWSGPDFLAVVGITLALAGFVLALFPAYRAGGVLFPIGLALLAVTGYWARYRDSHLA